MPHLLDACRGARRDCEQSMKREHVPHRKAPAFTLEQNARIRTFLREIWKQHGTQKAASEVLGLRDRDARVVNDVLAGGLAPPRLVVALAQYRGVTIETLLGGGS
jgi:hypothetical protein